MKFSCTVIFDASSTVEVEANSPEEAAELAEDMTSGHQSLCHQCSNTLETGDALGVHVYDENCTEQLLDTTFRAGPPAARQESDGETLIGDIDLLDHARAVLETIVHDQPVDIFRDARALIPQLRARLGMQTIINFTAQPAARQAALSHANPESGPEASADAEIASHAKRLALELECLLLSCGDTAAVTTWWDSAHEALEKYRAAIDRLYPPEHPTFMGEPVVGKGGAL